MATIFLGMRFLRGYANQCGESLFETKEVDAIQEALTVLDRETVVLASK